MQGQLERLRERELLTIRGLLPHGSRILEIGGGSGFQANLMHSWGCMVDSIDIVTAANTEHDYYEVREYDGKNIPFGDASFDIVFSSNVLEHIRDLEQIFKEVHRVMKPDGMAIHILPTPSWRLWTSLVHYPYHLVKLIGVIFRLGRTSKLLEPVAEDEGELSSTRNARSLLSRILGTGPHGEYPSAASELWYFSRIRWISMFKCNGFDLVKHYPVRLFYTGYSSFPWLPMRLRGLLSFILGSSGRVFVMRTRPASKCVR